MNSQKNQILILFALLVFFQLSSFASSDPCEDMFSAACLDSSGENKFKDLQKTNEKKMQQKVKQARDAAAQRQRFKNYEDLQKARLEAAGLPVVEGFDIGRLNGEDAATLNMADVFKDANDCRASQQQLENSNVYNMQTAEEIETQSLQRVQAAQRFQIVRDNYYAKDLPQFIRDLNNRCQQLTSSENYDANQNAEMLQVCGRLQSVRGEAIDLFREEGTADYQQKALAFVNRNRIRSLIPKPPPTGNVSDASMGGPYGGPMYGYGGGMMGGVVSGTANPYAQLSPEVQAEMLRQMQLQQQRYQEQMQVQQQLREVRARADAALAEVRTACVEVNSIVRSVAADVVMATLQESSRDRVTIETLIDSVYTPEKKARVEQMFNQSRQSVADFAQLNVGDQTKRNTIVSSLDEMQLGWLQKPDSSMYVTVGNRQILNVNDPVVANTTTVGVWSNPQLSFFTETNAFYTPNRSYGNTRVAEMVTLQPTMLELMNDNPDAVRFVLGHEVGHRLGPRVSEGNGYGMSGEYAALLSCYRSSGSIRMQENQKDEVIADYIGAEVVAQQVAALPAADRRNAILRSMEFFCMTDANEGHGSLNCKGSHPEQRLRVAGVYGTNPSIRNLLGCSGESSRYKTCGAGRSILESANTRAATSRTNEQRSPVVVPTENNRQNQNRGRSVR